jgi:hypothetical protein
MAGEQQLGCGIATLLVFLCAAVFAIILLAVLGPTIGNVFSNVIDGLRTAP